MSTNPIIISKITIENLRGFIYPVLHINGEDENGREYTRYLMPFRLYKFQVCGNIEGECDCGSSEPKKFRDIVEYSYDPEFKLKKELCCCLNNYLNTSYGYPGRVVRITYDDQIYRNEYLEECDHRNGYKDIETYKLEDMIFIDEFIRETINVVKREYKIA